MSERQLHLFGSEEDRVTKKRYTVILPLDTLILLLVVTILLFTLSFSLGVERGRRIVYLNAMDNNRGLELLDNKALDIPAVQPPEATPSTEKTQDGKRIAPEQKKRKTELVTKPQSVKQENLQKINLVEKRVTDNRTSSKVKQGSRAAYVMEKQATIKMDRYIIQVASYSSRDMAQNEANKLGKKGYPVFISKKGKFIAVFVGEFTDKAEARRNEKLLRLSYSDCLLKSL